MHGVRYRKVPHWLCQLTVVPTEASAPDLSTPGTRNSAAFLQGFVLRVNWTTASAVEELYGLEVNPFVAPEKTRHGTRSEPAPQGWMPDNL